MKEQFVECCRISLHLHSTGLGRNCSTYHGINGDGGSLQTPAFPRRTKELFFTLFLQVLPLLIPQHCDPWIQLLRFSSSHTTMPSLCSILAMEAAVLSLCTLLQDQSYVSCYQVCALSTPSCQAMPFWLPAMLRAPPYSLKLCIPLPWQSGMSLQQVLSAPSSWKASPAFH